MENKRYVYMHIFILCMCILVNCISSLKCSSLLPLTHQLQRASLIQQQPAGGRRGALTFLPTLLRSEMPAPCISQRCRLLTEETRAALDLPLECVVPDLELEMPLKCHSLLKSCKPTP